MYFDGSTTDKNPLIGIQDLERCLDARVLSLITLTPTQTNSFALSELWCIASKSNLKKKSLKSLKAQFES